ncbi:MAG: hypothetical protein K0R24_2296 [Gammaproteobacteria bacterium]|nr:hypothetical protein [Gammaproteobacteria bacterium]
MKKSLPLALSLILGTSIAIAAETAPPVSVVDVLQRLDQAGYRQIQEIEHDDGTYKVEAFGPQGQKINFEINSRNMQIPPLDKKGKSYLTMLQVARKLQGIGYTRIDQIEFDDDYYDVKAYDANNKAVKLEVNSVTGEINKD